MLTVLGENVFDFESKMTTFKMTEKHNDLKHKTLEETMRRLGTIVYSALA